MKAELIHEFQLMQNSLANKFAGEMTDKILSSVSQVNEKVLTSLSKRGHMLLRLEHKFNFKFLAKIKKHFLK